jgi:hypothetical protein
MGTEVGSEKVGGGKLGAFAEELGAGLEVGDTAVEVKGIELEGRKPGSIMKEVMKSVLFVQK